MSWNGLVDGMDRTAMRFLDDSEIAYTPYGGSAVPLDDGLFDESYEDVSGGEAGFAGARPMVFCRLADLPEDPDQEQLGSVTVNGDAYRIVEVQKDGHGAVRLFLHRSEAPVNVTVPGAPTAIEQVED